MVRYGKWGGRYPEVDQRPWLGGQTFDLVSADIENLKGGHDHKLEPSNVREMLKRETQGTREENAQRLGTRRSCCA